MDYKISKLFGDMRPHILDLISFVGGSGGPYAPTPHDLQSGHHTGSISDAQAPQFLKTDGSRALSGNLVVSDGVTIDGVDLSAFYGSFDAHRLATAMAGHNGLGQHSHESVAEGGTLDHGLALTGLADDDHPHYLNIARHDTTDRHTLGSVVPHDEHGNLFGLADDDHLQYFRVDGTRPMAGHILPSLTDTYDIGTELLMWRKAWISEIEAVLFAEQTASLVGGWLIVPHDQGSLPADVLSTDTEIDFGKTMTPGDFLVLRRPLVVEYMQVGALVSGTVYSVTRDVDGSGANDWPGGSAFLVLGTSGNGRIELNAYDTPRISLVEQGAAYNAQTEQVRIGDLDGWQAAGLTGYGLAMGDFAGGEYLTYAPGAGLTVRGTINADDGYLGTLQVSGVLSVGAAGGIYQGSGSFGTPTTGLKVWSESGIGSMAGYNAGVQQWVIKDGKFQTQAGEVRIDRNGVAIAGGVGGIAPPLDFWPEAAILKIGSLKIWSHYLFGGPGMDTNTLEAVYGNTYGSTIIRAKSSAGPQTEIQAFYDRVLIRRDTAGAALLDVDGNIRAAGAFISRKNSVDYTGYIVVRLDEPLRHASWSPATLSTAAKSGWSLTDFGVPSGAKGVFVNIAVRDSGAATTDCFVSFSPVATVNQNSMTCRCFPANDRWANYSGLLPLSSNATFYYQPTASGAGTLDVYLEVNGYLM